MAIAYARVTICSRSQGQSAVAAAAYRAATKLIDHRTNEKHDYLSRVWHVYSEIILPAEANNKFLDREYFWNEVENSEKRKDAQLAKSLLVALPKEINHDQRIFLVKEFSKKYFVDNNVPVDINIYDKNDDNPFAYIFSTTRRLLGNKFDSHKARDLNPGFRHKFIKEKDYWGKLWGEFQSEFFLINKIPAKVDEIGTVPQIHEGEIKNTEIHYLKEENKFRKKLAVELKKLK